MFGNSFNQLTKRPSSSDNRRVMQHLDLLDELGRKRDRRFECHPAQSGRICECPAVEAEPCIPVDEDATAIDEFIHPDHTLPKLYGNGVVHAEPQKPALK
jgi:hypothetical protein